MSPQVGIDGRAADAEGAGNGCDGRALGVLSVDRLVGRDSRGVVALARSLCPLLSRRGVLAPPLIHPRDGQRAPEQ